MRIEHDLLGEKSIPDDVYYGVQTARALYIEVPPSVLSIADAVIE